MVHTAPDHMRVVTYNVHKCRGLDHRVRPDRIVEMLREIDADIIALQEVLRVAGKREEDQAEFIAEAVGMAFCMGENRRLDGGAYGNLILSRHSLRAACNHDISTRGREPRGCMRVDVEVPAIGILTFSIFTWARATWNGVSRLGCS